MKVSRRGRVRELSTVSSAVTRAEARLARDPGFRRQLEKVLWEMD